MTMRSLTRDERGASLMLVAISMVVCLGMSALAIDVGMLYEAKAQAQNAADSGALAGAGNLLVVPNDAAAATVVAERFAELHEIIQEQVQIEPAADVQVDLGAERVTVTARRVTARGNAVPTFFAKILGWDVVDIQATATAEVQTASAAACLKPWAIPDAFDDRSAPVGEFNPGDYYAPGVTSWGSTYRSASADVGVQLTLKEGAPGDAIAPGQYFPIDLPMPNGPVTGGARYRDNIAQCNVQIVNIGDKLLTQNGNLVGPTKQGVADLIAQDPGAHWVTNQGIVDSAFPPGGSPRIAHVPMFDPRFPPTSGKQEVEITNIAGFFLEGISGNGSVTGRLMPASGTGPANPGTLLNTVRLVR